MATRMIASLIDDLDGGEAVSRVAFGYGGIRYEIDLSEKNRAELEAALAKFIARARRTGRMPVPADPKALPTAASLRREQAALRAWARKTGPYVYTGGVPGEGHPTDDTAP